MTILLAILPTGEIAQIVCNKYIADHFLRRQRTERFFDVAAENALAAKYDEPKTESGKRRAKRQQKREGKK